jgi:hypothetical protein
MNYQVIFGIVILIIIFYYTFRKDTFYNIQKEDQAEYDSYYRPTVYTNQIVPAQKNQDITKTELASLFRDIITYANGSPGGANVSVEQARYDLIFKDVLVCSDKRNLERYPNPNSYYVNLNVKIDKVYKAELIDVYIPAATDESVNIPTTGNRLYFSYTSTITVVGYVQIQAGTYMSPDSVAKELSRQFYDVLTAAGLTISKTVGVCVEYDKNLNRYIIKDKQYTVPGTLIIFTENGFVTPTSPIYTVTNSIASAMMLDSQPFYVSQPENVNTDSDGNLYVAPAVPGDYGNANGVNIPLNVDCAFSNCILSDVVLTHCKLYLSLGKLNGDTCNITPDENGTNKNVPPVFCQVPNNTCVSSAAVKTLLNQPHNFSAIQFYNPPISKVNKFEVKWYTDDGNLVRILDHCFTIRIYYFQKRISTTDFSIPIP